LRHSKNSGGINPKRPTPRYIVIHLAKIKTKNLERSKRTATLMYKKVSMRLLTEFSTEVRQNSNPRTTKRRRRKKRGRRRRKGRKEVAGHSVSRL
jgi:hypothetical protein